MYQVTLYKEGKADDISKVVENLAWQESLDTVGLSLSFSIPDITDRYISHYAITAGDIVTVSNNNEELIREVVVSVTREFPQQKDIRNNP